MKGLRPSNLRARLTLWYLTVFGGILVLYVACTSTLVYFGLREFLDEDLVEDIERTESLIQFTPDGAVRLAAVGDKADPDKREDVFIEILSRDGRVLYRNGELGNSQLGAAPVGGEGVG